jgi:hypothetical protein
MDMRRAVVLVVPAEVHFRTAPIELVPKLAAVSRRFRRWLSRHELVSSARPFQVYRPGTTISKAGSVRNIDGDIFALPSDMEALRRGQHLVADDDSEDRLETLCKALHYAASEASPRQTEVPQDTAPAALSRRTPADVYSDTASSPAIRAAPGQRRSATSPVRIGGGSALRERI